MKLLISAAILFTNAVQGQPSSAYCAPKVRVAIQAFTDVNSSVNESIVVLDSQDFDSDFFVQAQEMGTGQDFYDVKTTGGPDCTILAIKARGVPSKRP